MNLLDGIQLHELVLMILGFILGLVLIFVFLFMALQGRTNLKLLYGFVAPLVMIGYPSIQSVSFSKDVVKIDKLVQQVNQNPSDTAAQRVLMEQIQTLPKSRCVTSADALTTIADAQAALGLYDSAKVTIQKAIDRSPDSEKAKQSKQDIQEKWHIQKNFEQKVDAIKSNINDLEKRPNDTKLRDSIALRLLDLKAMNAPVRVEQTQAVWVAKAAAIVGEKKAAEQITDAVLSANPKLAEANKLKDDMKNKVIERKYGVGVSKIKTKVPVKTTPSPAPNSRTTAPTPPKVDAPAPVQTESLLDVSRIKFQLKPKGLEGFVKWDKEN
jgi:tetratricopeptide (TPR) repeat protein